MEAVHSRPYQGYPYVNPMVTDAPSITPETANRWVNLPRRHIGKGLAQVNHRIQNGSGSSNMSSPSPAAGVARPPLPSKRDPDVSPVVYIDLPESSSSDVVQTMERHEQLEGTFVQDTIMFDPFENRRIDVAKRSEDPGFEMSSMAGSSSGFRGTPGSSNGGPFTIFRYPEPRVHQGRPTPPNTLDLNRFHSPSTPVASSRFPFSNQRSPGVLSPRPNEGYVFSGGTRDEDTSPNGGSNYLEPPPAYTETDSLGRPRSLHTGQRSPEAIVQQPRTIVITPDPMTLMGLPSHQRKFLTCHHCGRRVHTMVIKQNGSTTHIIGLIFFIFLMPLVALVYCSGVFRHKNHYCPNCNKLIGYVKPILGRKMYYVN